VNQLAYSIFDSAVGAFGTPFFCQNSSVAKRSCLGAMQTDVFGMFPDQFTLFLIGNFDNENGKFIPCEPSSIINFAVLKAQATVNETFVPSETLKFEE